MSVKRKWYITLMQTDSSKMVSLSISKNIGHILIVFIFLFVLFFGSGAYYIWNKNSDLKALAKLEKENYLLREKMSHFSTQMDSLLIKIRVMEDWEDNLRQERRLKTINPDVRALGSGGEPFNDPSFLPFDDNLHQIFNESLNKLNFVKAKTALTYETHFDLISSLQTRETLYKATPSIWPTFGRITDDYGYRTHPVFRHKTMHAGVDIANERGTPIYATADGVVSFSGVSGASGNLIRIDHVSGYQTRYAHLFQRLVQAGDSVKKGQIIATMGNSGVSTGSHLHYEVVDISQRRSINPNRFFNLSEDQIKIQQNTEFAQGF